MNSEKIEKNITHGVVLKNNQVIDFAWWKTNPTAANVEKVYIEIEKWIKLERRILSL